MVFIKIILSNFTLWRFKRRAKKLHKLKGSQYHVVPTTNNKLMIVNNTTIKQMNKSRSMKNKIRMQDVYRMSLYSTPSVSPFKK